MSSKLPLVYSCSGCSSAAQMANSLAIRLDRDEHAEMSCIAGVGGGVKSLVRVAQSGRPIIALDGCSLACVKHCLANHAVAAEKHFILSEFGVTKKKKHLFSDGEITAVYNVVLARLGIKNDPSHS